MVVVGTRKAARRRRVGPVDRLEGFGVTQVHGLQLPHQLRSCADDLRCPDQLVRSRIPAHAGQAGANVNLNLNLPLRPVGVLCILVGDGEVQVIPNSE